MASPPAAENAPAAAAELRRSAVAGNEVRNSSLAELALLSPGGRHGAAALGSQ
jgi:hypothetical protein